MGDVVSLPLVARMVDERDSQYRRTMVLASDAIPLVTAMAKAYTRDRGFTADGDPNEEIAAVIATAAARMASNTAQTAAGRTEGDVTNERRSWFTGWTLAEQFVLNRYRKRAQ